MKNQKQLFNLFKNSTGKETYQIKPEQPDHLLHQYFPAKVKEYHFKGV